MTYKKNMQALFSIINRSDSDLLYHNETPEQTKLITVLNIVGGERIHLFYLQCRRKTSWM